MKTLKNIFTLIGAILITLVILGGAADTITTMPPYAQIIVDIETKTYYAPPYIENLLAKNPNSIDISKLIVTTPEKTGNLQYEPDPECREQGYFEQNGRNLDLQFLEYIGILKPLQSRWNEDGSWNW
jgi:hypothetical protein